MPANFSDLDKLIRQHTPEGVGKKQILQMLHELEEGVNLCHNFFLGATNHRINGQGAWEKKTATRFQVNQAR